MWTVIAMHLKVVASFVCDTKTTTRADVEAIVRLLFFFFQALGPRCSVWPFPLLLSFKICSLDFHEGVILMIIE